MKVKVKSRMLNNIPKVEEPFDLFEPLVEEKKKVEPEQKKKKIYKQSILSKAINIVLGDIMRFLHIRNSSLNEKIREDNLSELFE